VISLELYKNLWKVFGIAQDKFVNGLQHDAGEFLTQLLDRMNYPAIDEAVTGGYGCALTCLTCRRVRHKLENFQGLRK
jgi:uncharacterized UBP type Zn finger protein